MLGVVEVNEALGTVYRMHVNGGGLSYAGLIGATLATLYTVEIIQGLLFVFRKSLTL